MAQLEYYPELHSYSGLTNKKTIQTLLVVGSSVPSKVPIVTKMVTAPQVKLPIGVYFFEIEAGLWHVMYVESGSEPGPLASANWDSDDDSPLVSAYGWFNVFIEESKDVPQPKFLQGQTVLIAATGEDAHVHSLSLIHI